MDLSVSLLAWLLAFLDLSVLASPVHEARSGNIVIPSLESGQVATTSGRSTTSIEHHFRRTKRVPTLVNFRIHVDHWHPINLAPQALVLLGDLQLDQPRLSIP